MQVDVFTLFSGNCTKYRKVRDSVSDTARVAVATAGTVAASTIGGVATAQAAVMAAGMNPMLDTAYV